MPATTSNQLANKTVLIVDDEEDLRELLVYEFERLGAKVLQASSGREALALTSANTIDVVVSDIRMPNGDGLELLDGLIGRGAQSPPVILISGFADLEAADVLARGAFGFLHKPFDRKALLSTVLDSLRK